MKIDFSSISDMDWVLFFSSLILIMIGIMFIYSSGVTSAGVLVSNEHIKQLVWGISGILWVLFLSLFDYSRLKTMTFIIYITTILILILTLIFGNVVNGARSWIGFMGLGIQPSEFAKISTILFLAAYLENSGPHIQKLHRLLLAFIIVLIPMGLILIQPDMGTALVYLPIFLVMAFMGGAKIRHVLFFLSTGIITIFTAVLPISQTYILQTQSPLASVLVEWEWSRILIIALTSAWLIAATGWKITKRPYFYGIGYILLLGLSGLIMGQIIRVVLKEYQIMRLIIFLDPQVDPQGAGWNIIQSVTAVGSGGMSGKGFLQGTQSHYQFLPQQSTDFIFSILAEEWGFIGGVVVFLLFSFMFIRIFFIISYSKDKFGVYIGSGILALFFFHLIVNIGMTMGVMPITGIPLYFLSYGGSSLWSGMICIGILMSIYHRRYRS